MGLPRRVGRPQGLGLAASDFKQAAVLKGCDSPLHCFWVSEFTGEFGARASHRIARQNQGKDCALEREVPARLATLTIWLHRELHLLVPAPRQLALRGGRFPVYVGGEPSGEFAAFGLLLKLTHCRILPKLQ